MLQNRVRDTCATISLEALPSRLMSVASGELLTVTGLDIEKFRSALEASPGPQCLALELGESANAQNIIQSILDDLAELALALWPAWPDTKTDEPNIQNTWRRAATRLVRDGKRPRFRRTPLALEFQQLLGVLPPDLLLLACLDPALPAAAAEIAALEWCAGHGARIVISCASHFPDIPPFDRILYGAIEITKPHLPVTERWIGPRGAPHPMSAIEKRVHDAVLRDPELGPLFLFNKNVRTNTLGFTACVDLLWQEGGVVVELDGREHFGDPKYGHDRHRDYELLIAGYLVLRITNQQVETDLAHTIEKIRNVVRYRQSQGSLPE